MSFRAPLGITLILAVLALVRPQPMALDPQRGLRAGGDAERLEDARHVRLDRLLRDPEALGDDLVGQAVGQQREDVELARRQLARLVRVTPGLHDLAGRTWSQRR